jgi:tetratricopeptide (TPR) repeat protein
MAARLAVPLALLALAAPRLAHPSDATADAWRRSYAAEARGDAAAAIEALARLPADEAPYVAALRRGWLLHLAGRADEAVQAYERAVGLAPQALEARLGLMLPLMAQRRWVDAERVGREALGLAPGDPTVLGRLAWIDYLQGRYEAAERGYRRALAAYPSSAEWRAGLGWALLKQGRIDEARAELRLVLVFAPDHAAARDGLAALQAAR